KTVGESSDIDQITNPDFFEALSRGAGITANQAQRTGFASDEGRVYSRLVFNNLEWIAPLSIKVEGRRRASLPFCPSCLATDKVPYYRKRWRYGFHPVCPEHGLLTNLCPECQQHYVYVGPDQTGGVNVPSGVIGVCRQCETRFRRTTIYGLEDSVLQLVTEIQALIVGALDTGWIEVGGRGAVHVCSYLQGLHILGSIFQHADFAPTTSAWIGFQADMRVPEWNRGEWIGSLESRPAAIRAWILVLTTWLTEEWPIRFVAMMKALNLTLSQLLPAHRPFWMVGPGIDELSQATCGRTTEEIDAARASLARQRQWAPNGAEVTEYMRTGRVPAIRPVSRPVHPVAKAIIQAADEVAKAKAERQKESVAAKKDKPRELYTNFEPAPASDDPTRDLDDATERLNALAEMKRKNRAKPTSG
ncbi:MAG: TniQ family protein, partial [Rhodocyclaceae bacterium]|nr:TniQ family protein [Rhodocyclaceae bacterium]